MLTEDMDITWKLQLKKWDVRFEPRALAWILMPETVAGLWKQRLRWAMGGMQIIGKYKSIFLDWRSYAVWPLFFEHLLSVLWAFSVATVALVYVADRLTSLIGSQFVDMGGVSTVDAMTSLLPEFSGVIIGTTCLLQMLVSMAMDRRYDHRLLFYYAWSIWYPFGFWLINMLTIIVALPAIALRKRGLRARWVSPDRGSPPPAGQLRADCNAQRPLVIDRFKQQTWHKRTLWTALTTAGWAFWITLWIPLLRALPLLPGNYTGTANTAAGHALRGFALTLLSHAHALGVMVACFMGWALLQSLAKQRKAQGPRR